MFQMYIVRIKTCLHFMSIFEIVIINTRLLPVNPNGCWMLNLLRWWSQSKVRSLMNLYFFLHSNVSNNFFFTEFSFVDFKYRMDPFTQNLTALSSQKNFFFYFRNRIKLNINDKEKCSEKYIKWRENKNTQKIKTRTTFRTKTLILPTDSVTD